MVVDLSKTNSLINQFVSEIRDIQIQKDRLRFRRNIERVGEIAAYEISKTLEYQKRSIQTPLGKIDIPVLKEQPVLGTILRAGLPLHNGLLNYFDQADNAFISAYRHHYEDGTFEIKLEYMASSSIENKILIIADPMLATGNSMALTLQEVFKLGKPKHTHIVSVIASESGIEKVRNSIDNFTLWTGAIDKELNSLSYIVPGLGDAGDLAFGEKMQH
ncbi:MAG: uracil phosphoribosyltransferase [Sphingobacteriales bacterium]|nr:MAG: uracil phosphoribosyltransferase [Sphingobacteriales bacterium]